MQTRPAQDKRMIRKTCRAWSDTIQRGSLTRSEDSSLRNHFMSARKHWIRLHIGRSTVQTRNTFQCLGAYLSRGLAHLEQADWMASAQLLVAPSLCKFRPTAILERIKLEDRTSSASLSDRALPPLMYNSATLKNKQSHTSGIMIKLRYSNNIFDTTIRGFYLPFSIYLSNDVPSYMFIPKQSITTLVIPQGPQLWRVQADRWSRQKAFWNLASV